MPDFATGKYALYVWTSYGALAVIFAWMIVDSLTRAAKWKREAERLGALRDAKKAEKSSSK